MLAKPFFVRPVTMMKNHNFEHATLAFITCCLLVLAYALSFDGHQLPLAFFWIPLVVAIGLVVFQCSVVETSSLRVNIVLVEVLAIGTLAHFLYVIPAGAGVIGRDIFADLRATQYDQEFGWPIPASVQVTGITRIVSEWPLSHFLGLAASYLLGIDLFSVSNPNNVMRWFPSVVSLATPLFWYTIAKRLYGRADVGLLASLASSLVFYNMMFHAWYVRETVAYVLLFAFILAFMIASLEPNLALRMKVVAILFLVGLLFSHHLTFLFALLFLTLALLLPNLVGRVLHLKTGSQETSARQAPLPAGVLLLAGATMFLAYLIYVGEPVFKVLVESTQALFAPTIVISVRSSGDAISRDRILLAARLVFGVIFAAFLVRQISRKEKTLGWDILGFAWGVATGLVVGVSYFVANVVNAGILRLEAFAWPIVLLPASHALVGQRGRAVGSMVLVAFIVLNVLIIPPYIYDSTASPAYQDGETSIRYSLALYAAATWFRANGTIVGDVSTFELFGDLGQRQVVTDFQIFQGNLTGISQYQWIVLRQENANVVVSLTGSQTITRVSQSTWDLFNSTDAVSKVYDSGDVEIFRVNQP